MELDRLKSIWNDVDTSASTISEANLHQMLNHRSKLPIALMKRNLRLEVFFLVLIYGFTMWLISKNGDREFLYYNITLLVIAILFFIYARYKYRLLNKMECMRCEVKKNINLQLISLEKLIKLYFQIGNIGVMLTYVIAGVISYLKTEGDAASFPQSSEIILFVVIGGGLAIINYYIGRWYLYYLYGKHIQKLKSILYEMDEADASQG